MNIENLLNQINKTDKISKEKICGYQPIIFSADCACVCSEIKAKKITNYDCVCAQVSHNE